MDQTSESEKVLQKQKYEEIIQILLSAGYFRARINTLAEFDKVVGGLCWCITMSGEDVDVDILFQENSTIGQKIALSETIVKALRKMNCPSRIQPHQIQGGVGGSDYTSIYPVIVWLVKKFFERRDERETKLRSFSISQFAKNYSFPFESKDSSLSNELTKILNRNKSVRKFRRLDMKDKTEEMRVHACLLEYGESIASVFDGTADVKLANQSKSKGNEISPSSLPLPDVDLTSNGIVSIPIKDTELTIGKLINANTSDLSLFEKKLIQVAKEAQREEKILAEQATKTEVELLQQMSQIKGEEIPAVSGSHIGAMVSLNSSEISTATATYLVQVEEGKKLVEENLATGKLGQAAAFKRQEQILKKQSQDVTIKKKQLLNEISASEEKYSLLKEEYTDAIEYNEQLKVQLVKLSELEALSSKQEELATLKKLIILNESLKSQEISFKESCKAQVADYKNRIQALLDLDDERSEENKKYREIQDMHSKVMSKYARLRELLAETNLEVATSSRIIDDVPTRTELIQYERRFGELYQQVAWKLEETRKYYDQYNTLDTTLGYIQKEIKLLNSISETFNEAMKDSSSKVDFLKQFEAIVKGVEETLKKQKNVLAVKTSTLDEMKATHQTLVDEQRRYFKAVKDFQEECNKNEWLLSKLEMLKHQ